MWAWHWTSYSTCCLACSRRSDRGDCTKRCEQKKKNSREWGSVSRGGRSFFSPSPSFPPYFFPALFLHASLYFHNAWNRLRVVTNLQLYTTNLGVASTESSKHICIRYSTLQISNNEIAFASFLTYSFPPSRMKLFQKGQFNVALTLSGSHPKASLLKSNCNYYTVNYCSADKDLQKRWPPTKITV